MPSAGDRKDLGRVALIHTGESAEDPERSSSGVAATGGCRKRESTQAEGRAAKKPPARSFNSKLRFYVWVVVRKGENLKFLGCTPADQPLTIPPSRSGWVEPLGLVDTEAVAAQVEAQGIPGLRFDGAPDADLAHLRHRLQGIQSLFLSDTKVTDAGVEELRQSLPHTTIVK